jgi:hypothetical protein
MEPLPARDAFPEPWIARSSAGASYLAEADFDGVIVFTSRERDALARALPEGWRLGHNTSAHPDLHPLVLIFGVQSRTALRLGRYRVPREVEFGEMLVVIPFVVHEKGSHLHVHVVRAYSGDAVSTWSGGVNYGLAKYPADIEWFGRTFTVSAGGGPMLFHATVDAANDWHAGTVPELAAACEAFLLPVLGVRPDGSIVSSYFDWDFRRAFVRRARIAGSIDAPLARGLEPQVCHGSDGGTFEIRSMRWRVTWPTPASL